MELFFIIVDSICAKWDVEDFECFGKVRVLLNQMAIARARSRLEISDKIGCSSRIILYYNVNVDKYLNQITMVLRIRL